MQNEMDDANQVASGVAGKEEIMSDFETALSAANEKNRKFLKQLKELTQANRVITDQNTALIKENVDLKSELASDVTVIEQLKTKVNQCEADKEIIASSEAKIKGLQEQVQECLLKITKLMVACEEKDRRIDLLAHHKHRQQKSDGWWKDGSDGGRSSDSTSVDSELSVSTLHTVSSDEPQLEYRFSPEDFHGMYQRLLSEHVTLERIHSETQFHLLQLKNRLGSYQEKIEFLTISLHEMKEKLRKTEIDQEELQNKLDEAQLENEQLEFQILEAQLQKEEELEHAHEQNASASLEPLSELISSKSLVAGKLPRADAQQVTNLQMKTNETNHNIMNKRQMTSKDSKCQDKKSIDLVHSYGEKSGLSFNNSLSKSRQAEEDREGDHLEAISANGKNTKDNIHFNQFSSETPMMLTPLGSAVKSQRHGEYNRGLISEIGDLEFPEPMIASEELLWRVVEDSDTTKGFGETKSPAYWKELEERMGLNVNDIALVLEFEDSFPDDNEDYVNNQNLPENSDQVLDLDYGNETVPPPLPMSVPPSEVKRDTGLQDFYEGQYLDIDANFDENVRVKSSDHLSELLDVFPITGTAESKTDSRSYSVSETTDQNLNELDIQSGSQRNNLIDHNSNSFPENSVDYPKDLEVTELKKRILELEKQLASLQNEYVAVMQSKEELKRDFDQIQKIVKEKEDELNTLQEEWERLKKQRNSHIPSKDRQTQTSMDLLKNLKDSASQTTDDVNFAKVEQLLEAKDKELGAKASEEALQLIRRLEQQRAELKESVTSFEVKVEQMDSITHERDSLKEKLMELEHNLQIKNDSETSLIQEVISLKKRVDDLQFSLEEFRGKEFDFETLQRKYEDLGNLTRRLQTAVAPMKARVARLALKCKTKDELMQRLMGELHQRGVMPDSLDAEVRRELTSSSGEDYTRPLSPLTISHLDQLNHKILKLDLTLNNNDQHTTAPDQAEFFRVFPESPGNSDAYMSMLNKSLQDIRQTTVSPVGQFAWNFYGQPANNLPVLINSNDTSVINENLKSFSEMNSVVRDVSVRSAKKDSEKVARISMNSTSSGAKISGHVSNGHFSAEEEYETSVEKEGNFEGINTMDFNSVQILNTGIPDCPSNFHVERLVGSGKVLLSWIPPSMDETSQSHGSVVAGYKVFINGEESLFISGPNSSKVLLKSLNFSRVPIRFSLQTVSENGQVSSPVETYVDHALLKKFQVADVVKSATSDDFAVSSPMSSLLQQEVITHRKMFLAIYDYHPYGRSSSKAVRQEELGFQTGDIIVTYGPMRPDGYYVGKVRGRRGLVPGSFLEELAPFASQDVAGISVIRRSRNTSASSDFARLMGRRSRSLGARLNITEFRPV